MEEYEQMPSRLERLREVYPRLEQLLKGLQNDVVLINENKYPPERDMEVVRRPHVNLSINFSDTSNLRSGRYQLFVTRYGCDDVNASYGEWIHARFIAGLKELKPDARRELADFLRGYSSLFFPEMNNLYVDDAMDCLAFGVHPIFVRSTQEERNALSFLMAYRRLLPSGFRESLSNEFPKLESNYTNAMTTFFAQYSLHAEGIKRTAARLPELAGRRIMDMRGNINAVLPLNYELSFLSEELASIRGDGLTVKVEEDLRLPTLEQQILSMLKQSGVSPLTATSRDGLDLVHEKLSPTYSAASQHVAKSLLAGFLIGLLPFTHDHSYESELLRSKVASQFDREEIAYLLCRAPWNSIDDFINETKEFARERGYMFPTTAEEAKRLGMM